VRGDDGFRALDGFVWQVKLVKSRWNFGVFISFHLDADVFAFEGQPASSRELLLQGRHLGHRSFPALARGDAGSARLDTSLRALGVPEPAAAAMLEQQRAIDAAASAGPDAFGSFAVGFEETADDLALRVQRELDGFVLPWCEATQREAG